MPVTTIQEAIDRLTEIIDEARNEASRIGYFPAMYRHITRDVKARLDGGGMVNPIQTAQLTVDFANRYFAEFDAFRNGDEARLCWQVAFNRTADDDLLIVQHLLLGINAHINFDLGISTAKVGGTLPALEGLKPDFDAINDILRARVNDIESRVGGLSPRFSMLDELAGETDERLMGFSLARARVRAWATATTLVLLPTLADHFLLAMQDALVTSFGEAMVTPFVNAAVLPIRQVESDDVVAIIDALAG